MIISEDLQRKLLCPATKAELKQSGDNLISEADPAIKYPIIDGIPILIDDQTSLFSINDFVNHQDTTWESNPNAGIFRKTVRKLLDLLPSISRNIKADSNYEKLISLLPANAKILVVGGSVKGMGMDIIYDHESFEILESDVSFGEYTKVICDAHDLPFQDNTFDCVIIQAVLEHVLEPQRCVSEIHRVLNDSGIVYAETPFMQQVHMKQYDFTRFTHLGHRWLFKNFEELMSGPCCGPGMALAWSYSSFLQSFTTSSVINSLLTTFAQITSFFFKYFDYFLINKPGAFDTASGYYFLGKKSSKSLSNKELIQQFKGRK
jgi:ubiquinone/menaquinone biosynthesis C-methylase UbiE/uncharacterized protein YbaR (Trm112 family)